VNICCEEREANLQDYAKNLMPLENFEMVVTNIDRRKSEEQTISLKMMADTIRHVGEQYLVALPYQNDVDTFLKVVRQLYMGKNFVNFKKFQVKLKEFYSLYALNMCK
jgi:hypothetical protein